MVSFIILAGGESKRFGEDKVFYEFMGRSFLERAVSVALDTGGEVAVCGRAGAPLSKYSEEASKAFSVAEPLKKKQRLKVLGDDKNCGLKGPVRGIHSALKEISGDWVMVMECDAPFFNSAAVGEIIKKAESEKVRAVVPVWPDSTVEPLLALYDRKSIMDALNILNGYALNLGDRFLFHDAVNILRMLPSVYYYSVSDMTPVNPGIGLSNFININSLEEVKKNTGDARVKGRDGSFKSIKVNRASRFFDVTRPSGAPRGNIAKALYNYWIYCKTGNMIYYKRSAEFMKEESILCKKKGLNFMGEKIGRVLPSLSEAIKECF